MIDGAGAELNSKQLINFKENRFERIDQNDIGNNKANGLQAAIDIPGKGKQLLQNFDRIDLNGNNEMERVELRSFHKHLWRNRFNVIKHNDSSRLSTEELQDLVERTGKGVRLLENFDRMDGDGELTPGEINAFKTEQVRQIRFGRLDKNYSDGLNNKKPESLVVKNGRGAQLLESFSNIDLDGNGDESDFSIIA